MPLIGIIRGFGEGYEATKYIIKLTKALNRRFRSKLYCREIPAGDYMEYGSSLKSEAVTAMRDCDVIYVGDMCSRANPLEYSVEHIAMALSDDIEYTCISGFGNHGTIDVQIASYFDGGFKLRQGETTVDGCTETRVCSTFASLNIVKYITRECEARRRRLAFVKDGDNEYCADLFYSNFEKFVLPLTNFHLLKFSIEDICSEILYDPKQFDTIFASKAFSEMARGMYKAIMKEDFAAYTKFAKSKAIYAPRSVACNSACGDAVLSINSYIIALCDLLAQEFNMQKEAVHLRLSLDTAIQKGADCENCNEFINMVITELNKPVSTKFSRQPIKSRYIK